jgi:hypothetical protein
MVKVSASAHRPGTPVSIHIVRCSTVILSALLIAGCGDDSENAPSTTNTGDDTGSDAGDDAAVTPDTGSDNDGASSDVGGTPDGTDASSDATAVPEDGGADGVLSDSGTETDAVEPDSGSDTGTAGDGATESDAGDTPAEPVLSLVTMSGANGPSLGTIARYVATGTAFEALETWRAGALDSPISFGSTGNYLADVDGDGLDDIVCLSGATGPSSLGAVFVDLAGETGFGAPTAWLQVSPIAPVGAGSTFNFAADITGDGLADVVTFTGAAPPAWGGIGFYASTGSAFSASATARAGTPDSPVFGGTTENLVGDINGDGRDDLILMSGAQPPNWGGVAVALSTGTGFSAPSFWYAGTPEAPVFAGSDANLVAEVNNDGFDDLITLSGEAPPSWGGLQVLLSNGSQFASPAIWRAGDPFSPVGAGTTANFAGVISAVAD